MALSHLCHNEQKRLDCVSLDDEECPVANPCKAMVTS